LYGPSISVGVDKSRGLSIGYGGAKNEAHRIIVGAPFEKCPVVRPKSSWYYEIEVDREGIGCDDRFGG
jgi:hypothetical protein